MKGWGPKSSVCPPKPMETKLFSGISRTFAGISRAPEKFEKNKNPEDVSALIKEIDAFPLISEDFPSN